MIMHTSLNIAHCTIGGMMNISACLIVKNEEKHLRECLESLRTFDEIILVDTGSTDKTLSIAGEFSNVKIYKKKFDIRYFSEWKLKKLFHFSNARNYAISKATKDWIFIIDADERIQNPLDVANAIEEDKYDAFRWLQMQRVKVGNEIIESPCSTTRMFRNHKGIQYRKIVHETPDEYLDENGLTICQTENKLIHVGFIDPAFNKHKAYRVIEAIKYEKQPYMWYYLGVCYIQIQDLDNATECFLKAVNVPMAKNIKAHAWAILADIMRQSSLFYSDLAQEYLQYSLELVPNQNRCYIILAEILKSKGKKSQAQKIYKEMMNKDTMKTEMHQDILLTKGDLQGMSNDCFV